MSAHWSPLPRRSLLLTVVLRPRAVARSSERQDEMDEVVRN